jgi:hypothetical protein
MQALNVWMARAKTCIHVHELQNFTECPSEAQPMRQIGQTTWPLRLDKARKDNGQIDWMRCKIACIPKPPFVVHTWSNCMCGRVQRGNIHCIMSWKYREMRMLMPPLFVIRLWVLGSRYLVHTCIHIYSLVYLDGIDPAGAYQKQLSAA